MSVIINALAELNQSLERLEGIASEKAAQEHLRGSQHDLFGGSEMGIDPALVAKKLDVTIARVEQLLKEG